MDLEQRIRSKGIKATPQRRLVYEVLEGLSHAPVDEVAAKVRAKNPCVTLSTVYRILDSFHDAGLVSRLNHPDGKSYYDITPAVHHHIYTDRNEILDYIDDELSEMIRDRLRDRRFGNMDIERISIQIFAKTNFQK